MGGSGGENWSHAEVEAVVADYLHMLTQELAGQAYSKIAHRRALQVKLRNRSDGSIERKHQNVSAVLIELGCPYIAGYKPLPNYQRLLFDVLAERLGQERLFDQAAALAVERPAVVPLAVDFKRLVEPAPLPRRLGESEPAPYAARTVGLRRDYLDREARNRSLGVAGEAFVVEFERFRLHAAGAKRLSDHVEHVTQTKGDGLGYDVLSFETDGRPRFIEVKTTAFGKETPFFISCNEVAFSGAHAEEFHLYRLFEFRRKPRMFDVAGDVQRRCQLDAVSFIARFA